MRRRTEHLFSEFAHPEVQRLENSTLEFVEALGQHRDTFLAKVAAKLKVVRCDLPSHIQFFRQDDLSNRVATCCANPRFRSEKRALKSMKETIKTTKALKMSQYAQMTMKVLNSNITSKDFANT